MKTHYTTNVNFDGRLPVCAFSKLETNGNNEKMNHGLVVKVQRQGYKDL